jgi:hypothetical protein
MPHGIFLRRPARAATAWHFSSEALRKKILHGFFRPKLCARKYCMAVFVRRSAQENIAWHFSSEGLRKKILHGCFRPKLCARKCDVAFFSEGLRKKMPRESAVFSASGNLAKVVLVNKKTVHIFAALQ